MKQKKTKYSNYNHYGQIQPRIEDNTLIDLKVKKEKEKEKNN